MAEDKRPDHILIVDDTLKNIQVLGAILRKEGFQINVAQNGQQALDSVKRVIPDLILLDIMMPVMDGFETCKHLKADPNTEKIPVIFLTAKVNSEDIVKGLTLGAVDYVTKPFNATELLSRVDTHLTIRRLQVELENRVAELAAALDDIERLHREHSAFLRHELNNAISPILGYADLLLKKGKEVFDEKQLKWTEKILSGTRSMQEMLTALKKLQDFERGELAMDLSRADLSPLLKQVIKDFETGSRGRVSVELDIQGDGCWISADVPLLKGVFKNLLKNAIEHVSPLEDEADRNIRVTLSRDAENVLVTVNNRGEPVPADRLKTFFEKFNSTKKGKGGTGLGTSYAYLVTRAHRGTISVVSNADDGTTVNVSLPVAG